MIDLIYFLLIGLAAGWLAGKLMEGHSFGLLGNLVVGVVGAILGGFLVPPRRTSDHRAARKPDLCHSRGNRAVVPVAEVRQAALTPSREGITMAGKGRQQTARKPATKFAHLRKKMEKNRIASKISKKKEIVARK